MVNIRLDIQYKGTEYSGWQVQKNAVSIQGLIETAIRQVTGQDVTLYGAGRTDAGVHALNQVANFHIEHRLPPEKYREAINFYLPRTIRIIQSGLVPDPFHARHSAQWRRYRYIIGRSPSALYFDYRWEWEYPLNIDVVNRATQFILGRHDFSAFCTVASQSENNECQIFESSWRENPDEYIFEIRANRFLHSMVRSLVGLMTDCGRPNHLLTLNDFQDIMKSGDHTRIPLVAPARGLYLVAVGY